MAERRYVKLQNQDPMDGHAGQMPVHLLPEPNPTVELVKRILHTILVVGLFLIVCKATHFRQKMLYDARINRSFLYTFYFLIGMVFVLYFYLSLTLRWLRPRNKRIPVDNWDKHQPIPFYTAVVCLVLSVISFIFALWPAFSLATLAIGLLGFTSVIFVLQWVPFDF